MFRVTAFAVAGLAFLLPATVHADLYIKTEMSSTGFAGIGGTEGETEVWFSGKRQCERTKIDVKSPVLKPFWPETKERTITDLEQGKIIQIDDDEKTWREMSFPDMKAQIESMKEQLGDTYENTKSGGAMEVPRVEDGQKPDVKIDVVTGNEEKKFAGMKAKQSTLRMLADAVDTETGEKVTFKVVYDVWLTPEFKGRSEMSEYEQAAVDMMGIDMNRETASLAAALASAGLTVRDVAGEAGKLEGYPVKTTVRFGSVLTPEQKAELEKAMEDAEKKDSGGGGIGGIGKTVSGGIGGLTKKATDEATNKLAEEMVKSLFGEGVTTDAEGDPVFFTFETEVKKVEVKSADDKVFEIPEKYTKLP